MNVANIDEIARDAEKELNDLEKIDVAIVSIFPDFSENIAAIRSKLYLLDPSAGGRIEEKLNAFEFHLNRVLNRISSHAEELFEEIAIIEKIK